MASKTKTSNVIVVGGGLAGLCATVEAASHGAKVTLIDKEKNTGGNSAKATSGMNGAGTEAQKAKGVKDDISSLVKDTLASGDKLSVPELVEVLARNSVLAHEWLLTTFGLNLSNVVQLGGHSKARTHRFPPTPEGKPVPVGWTLVSTLRKYIDSNLKDDVTIITNAVFKDVIMKDGVVTGLHYTDINNEVKTLEGVVILTAGGYANDHTNTSLLEKFVPDLAKLPTTNGPWATGDIIKSTSKIGIKYTLMNYVQVHPTGFLEPSNPKHHTKFLAPEALRGCGAILLDSTGNRFVNELGRRDHVSEQIFNSCGPFQGVDDNPKSAIMLLSNQVIEKFGAPSAGFYKFKQLIQDVGSLAQLAEKVNIDVEALKQTLSKYRSAAKEGKDQFGKTVFPVVFSDDDHFLVAFITPTLHYCMGGIAINPKAQVLKDLGDDSSMDSVIEGLYAAGEVSGGVHGKNRLGGNSLLECVVFGRVAGQQAAHFTSKV